MLGISRKKNKSKENNSYDNSDLDWDDDMDDEMPVRNTDTEKSIQGTYHDSSQHIISQIAKDAPIQRPPISEKDTILVHAIFNFMKDSFLVLDYTFRELHYRKYYMGFHKALIICKEEKTISDKDGD